MPLIRLSERDLETPQATTAFDALEHREVSAVVIFGATHRIRRSETGKISVEFPWLDRLELFSPDRDTEIAGTRYTSDMPAHVDPHPRDSLKVHLTRYGSVAARFALEFPANALDEHNEVPLENYEEAYGITTDTITLKKGDAVCFYGSTTLHQFTSLGESPRESVLNSYKAQAAEYTD